jgi:hypothetical protein
MTHAKQTLALLCSPCRANALSAAPRLASAILRKLKIIESKQKILMPQRCCSELMRIY